MSYGLSKSKVIAWRQCPKRLWLQVHQPELIKISDADQHRFDTGHRVGEIARSLYHGSILIETSNLGEAIIQTQAVLKEHADLPIFEATFVRDGVLCQADVLVPEGRNHRMIEVKSSTAVKNYHLEDCAVQSWIIDKGINLTDVALSCIDNQFIYRGDGDYRGLLKSESIVSRIELLRDEVPGWVAGARETLAGGEPKVAVGNQCTSPYTCPFHEYCHRDIVEAEYPLTCLPRLSSKQKVRLEALRVRDIRDIPPDFPLTETQQWVDSVTRSGIPSLNPEAAKELASLTYPRFYLDFETVGMAIPLWSGTRPYQAIPVQWSCHIEPVPYKIWHKEHLASGDGDPRRSFAMALIEAVGTTGPVFVYHEAFERRIIRELVVALPDLARPLTEIEDRIVDLLPIVRRNYYHPEMLGSWSIKAVLPTIDPTLAYEFLDISDGQEAQRCWDELLTKNPSIDRQAVLNETLSAYCTQDTWAMVRLAWFLQGMDGGTGRSS